MQQFAARNENVGYIMQFTLEALNCIIIVVVDSFYYQIKLLLLGAKCACLNMFGFKLRESL